MAKTHYKIYAQHHRHPAQSEYDFNHQSACGYTRKIVTTNGDEVDCKWCISSIHMINYHATKDK